MGRQARIVEAEYKVLKKDKWVTKKSILLASGWWGVASTSTTSRDHRLVLLDRPRALRQAPALPLRRLPHHPPRRSFPPRRHQVLAQVRQALEEVLRAGALPHRPGNLLSASSRSPGLGLEPTLEPTRGDDTRASPSPSPISISSLNHVRTHSFHAKGIQYVATPRLNVTEILRIVGSSRRARVAPLPAPRGCVKTRRKNCMHTTRLHGATVKSRRRIARPFPASASVSLSSSSSLLFKCRSSARSRSREEMVTLVAVSSRRRSRAGPT